MTAGIRKALTLALGLRENSENEVGAGERRLAPTTAASYNLDELLAAIKVSNLHEETDWGPAVGNEVW